MWDRIVVEKMEECVGDLLVDVSFKNTKDGFLLAFASMVQTQIMRESLWDELAGLCSLWSISWSIWGEQESLHWG